MTSGAPTAERKTGFRHFLRHGQIQPADVGHVDHFAPQAGLEGRVGEGSGRWNLQLFRQQLALGAARHHLEHFGGFLQEVGCAVIHRQVLFQLLEHNQNHAFEILPGGDGIGDLVEQADAAELLPQITRAFLDAFFQFVPGQQQRVVALLDLSQHFIEAVNELAEFVRGFLLGANGIIFLRRNGFGRLRQMGDGAGNDSLQS